MRDRRPISLLLSAAVMLSVVTNTLAQGLVFPEEMLSTSCTLQSGQNGRCLDLRSCSALHDTFKKEHPHICRFNVSYPIVCCPESKDGDLEDITAPNVAFECGRNARKVYDLQCKGLGASQALRPRAASRSPTTERHQIPRFRPGIPAEALSEEAILPCSRATEAGTISITVVGGVQAEKNAWPWMALIGTRDAQGIKWFCAGVLINEQWVLSALHCFLDNVANVVRLGEHDYNDDNDGALHEDFDVAEVIVHPNYALPATYHDLALLRLTTKVTLKNFISPVCLPWGRESNVDLTDQKVTLAGWGDTSYFGFPSSVLQEVDLTVFQSLRCDAAYSGLLDYARNWPQGIGEETLCAGDPNGGKDACQGDSGGPIMSLDSAGRYVAAGIVSQGFGCGLEDFPGLYVNLRRPEYLAWIKKVAF